MGGKSKQKQTNTSTQSATTTGTTAPWEATLPALNSILGQYNNLPGAGLTGVETGALDAMYNNARGGNPYAAGIGTLATDLLGGGIDRTGIVEDAYSGLQGGLTPYTNMDTNPYSNEAFTKATGYLTDDITDRIKSAYAGAGYSPVRSGDYGQTVGEGIARGVAPTWLDAYNQLEGRKLGAINTLYNAGNTTAGLLSGLDQTALGNRQAGIGVSQAALQAQDQPYQRMLEIEAMRRGIPVQNLAQLESLIIPAAQLGGTTMSDSRGEASSLGISSTKTPLSQQIFGGLLGGVGLLGKTGAFGPAGYLTGGLFGGGGSPVPIPKPV